MNKKTFLAATMGTLIEQYDFVLFATLLPILAPIFFVGGSFSQSLLKSYYFLLIVLLARPVGGLMFGYIGDFFGRRTALLISIIGITMSTFLIGLTPGYARIGIWAPCILLLLKIIQTLCFGGEYSGAGIYVAENAGRHNSAYLSGLLTAQMLVGALIASFTATMVTFSFMPAWTWRLAFMLAGLFGVVVLIFRRHLVESGEHKTHGAMVHSLKHLWKNQSMELITVVCIGGFVTIPYTTVLVVILPLFVSKGILTPHQDMMTQVLLIVCCIFTLLFSGKLADKITAARVMKMGCLLLMVSVYPILKLVDLEKNWLILFSLALLLIANEMVLGPSNTFLKDLFHAQYRYRAIAFSFCAGISIFGGLTPIVEYKLFTMHNHFASMAVWPALVGAFLLFFLQRHSAAKKLSSQYGCLSQN